MKLSLHYFGVCFLSVCLVGQFRYFFSFNNFHPCLFLVVTPPWPKSVTWYNKEGKVETSEKYRLIEDGLGSYMIEIKPSESCDEGEWKCVVTSIEGCVGISTCHVGMESMYFHRKYLNRIPISRAFFPHKFQRTTEHQGFWRASRLSSPTKDSFRSSAK
jgi:Immunoglobulin I-set domain